MNIIEQKNIIEEIRLLPNDKITFPTYADIYNFLVETMNERGGIYYFPTSGMNCPANTVVLFQYNNSVIASAFLKQCCKKPSIDEIGNKYKGFYLFDMESMTIFSNPISKEEIMEIDDSFTMFSQSKQRINFKDIDKFIALIKKHTLPTLSKNPY